MITLYGLNNDMLNMILNFVDIITICNFKLMCRESNQMNLILTNFELVYEVKPKFHKNINNELNKRNSNMYPTWHYNYDKDYDLLSDISNIKRLNIKYLLKYKDNLEYIRIKFFIKKDKYEVDTYYDNSRNYFMSSGYYINDYIDDDTIIQFNKLKKLKLSGNNNITDVALSKFPNMEVLYLPCNKKIKLENIQFNNLKEINIYGNSHVPVKNMLKYYNLKKISVGHLNKQDIEMMEHLKLVEVKSLLTNMDDDACKYLKNINKLKIKTGNVQKLTGKEFGNFLCESCRTSETINMKHSENCIKYLCIYNNTQIKKEYYSKLTNLEYLTTMNDDLDIDSLKNLTKLKTLCLPNDRNLTLDDLCYFPNLERLELVNNKKLNFQNKNIKKILPNLKQLNISGKYFHQKSIFENNNIDVTFDKSDIPNNVKGYESLKAVYTSI